MNQKMFVPSPLDTCLTKIGTRLMHSVDLLSLVLIQIWILLSQILWTPERNIYSCLKGEVLERNKNSSSERNFCPDPKKKEIEGNVNGLHKNFFLKKSSYFFPTLLLLNKSKYFFQVSTKFVL